MIKAFLLFIIALWILKIIIDLLEYRRVSKLHKHGLELSSGTDHGLSIDLLTGDAKTTKREVLRA